jgi:hypothetical protein
MRLTLEMGWKDAHLSLPTYDLKLNRLCARRHNAAYYQSFNMTNPESLKMQLQYAVEKYAENESKAADRRNRAIEAPITSPADAAISSGLVLQTAWKTAEERCTVHKG